jgi:phosphatidylserine decarboxylase
LEVTIKSITWEISELLEGNPCKERFNNGIFAHSFLSPAAYHRQHAPVGGVVLEARVIPGQLYLEVNRKATEVRALNLVPQRKLHSPHNKNHIRPHPDTCEEGCESHSIATGPSEVTFDAPDRPGYQLYRAGDLIVLHTAIDLAAVLPMGIAQVSSLILTAEVVTTLRKERRLVISNLGQ